MDIGRCIDDLLLVLLLLCLHRGIYGLEDDYEDTPSFGRCPWIRNKLKNGRVKLRYRGRVAKFLCDSGYELAGKRSSTCVRGQWNSPIPVCVARGCSRVTTVPNGRVTEMYRGALLVYDCNPGYTIDGETSIHCDGRRWNASPPSCAIASENPETFCDFESSDLCGWTQDPNHDFDWFRNQHTTPSGHVGTGPSYDHTFGENKGGFYLYIEASSPRKINDTARLFSPVYPANLSGGCFLFWYHMYGATTGGLRVYLKPESHVFDELTPRWQKYGDQGNQWFRGNIIVPVLNENFQIVIEGVRGESYVGDSAIDDVRLTSSICEDVDETIDNTESTVQDSCRGRCREAHSGTSCGCSDSCYEVANCCNDYLAICGAGNETVVQNTDEPSPFDLTSKTSSPVTAITSLSTLEPTEGSSLLLPKSTHESEEVTKTTVTTHASSTPSMISSTTIMSTANTQTPSTLSVFSTGSTLNTEEPSTIRSTMNSLLTTSSLAPKTEQTTVPSVSTARILSTRLTEPAIVTETSPFVTSTTSFPSTSSSTTIPSSASTITETTQAKSSATAVPSTRTIFSTVPVSSSTESTTTTETTSTSVPSTESSTTTLQSTFTFPAAITTLSSTRKTYNLRPRTRTTSPFSTTEYTTPQTQSTTTSILTSTTEATTVSEAKTSTSRATMWYRYTASPSTKADTTSKPTTTTTSPIPTTVSTTTQSSFQNIPQTTKFPYRVVKSTQKPLPTQSDAFESNASEAESVGGKSSTAAVISIVVIVIICLAGAGAFYVRRQRNKRQSKLSDDSEMRFLPESDYMEYSDSSALDKIMSR